MKYKFLFTIAGIILSMFASFQTANAQSVKVPAKENSLIAYLVAQADQPDSHTVDDVYLRVTIGRTEYIAELKSGKVVSQNKTANPSGGFSGMYAEVGVNLLDKNKQETAQGAGQILKSSGGKWKTVALSEGDYQCSSVKSVPKAVLKALQVECN